MQRQTIVIISDDSAFSSVVTNRWSVEQNAPSFTLLSSEFAGETSAGTFDLAVIGRVAPEALDAVLETTQNSGKPAIFVSRLNGHTPRYDSVSVVPETAEWPGIVFVLAQEILRREQAIADLKAAREAHSQLEHDAFLGRYMLEVRHNLNNALTSILGNSDLILLDHAQLPSAVRDQVETIRNMGMRMNEILHRFSSLQIEMRLVEEQNLTQAAKVVGASKDKQHTTL